MSHTEIRPAADPVVTVRGLTKSYGGRMVVDHLDLDVHAGQIVGLIGTNGAGKTTTVEILQGLRRADAGEIRVLGSIPPRTRTGCGRRSAASCRARACPTGWASAR